MKTILFSILFILLPALAQSQSIGITWQDNSNNELGFGIERCELANCSNFKEIARTKTNINQFLDSVVAANTTYCYRVYAFNESLAGVEQRSGYTNISCATTKPIDPIPAPIPVPQAPGNLETIEVKSTSLKLRWEAPLDSRIVAHQIELNDHRQGRPERFRLITGVLPELREWRVEGLSRNSTYYFRVRSCIAIDSLCSEYSNIAAVKTPR